MSRGTRDTATAERDETDAAGRLAKVAAIVARVQSLRPFRVLKHLSDRDGNLLAAGMSFQSFFAIFAAIWVLFAVAGLFLTSSPVLTGALIDSINATVPGLIGEKGAIDPSLLLDNTALSWTGAIALAGLLWKAIGWMGSTRRAVRAIFDLDQDPRSFIVQKSSDLGLAFGFGLLLIASAVLSVATGAALDFLFALLGLGAHSVWADATARLIGFAIAVGLNAVALGTMYRVLSQVRIPFRSLVVGSLMGGVALVIMSAVSGLLLGGAGRNPLLASFVVVIGLMIWFNLVCHVILLAASWIAVGMADRGISPRDPERAQAWRRSREHQARIVVADAEIADARGRLADARWPRTVSARRRLRRAVEARAVLEAHAAEADARSARPGAGSAVGGSH